MRVAPLPADQWDDTVYGALRMIPAELRHPAKVGNAVSTFINHPDLTRPYLTFSFYLLTQSTLAPRLRELAVLRIAHLTACAYEWAEHVVMAKGVGLTEDDINALQRGEADDDFDRTVLSAVDELLTDNRISDQTWASLGEQFDTRQLMDFVFTVGGYHMLAMALNTFGVEPQKEN